MLGAAYLNAHYYPQAVEYFTKALTVSPGWACPYSGLAETYLQQEKYSDAVEKAGQAIRLDPEFSTGYLTIGDIYCAQQRYDEALFSYKTAIEKDNENIDAYVNAGLTCLKLSKKTQALEYFRQAWNRNPGDPNLTDLLGIAYVYNKDFDHGLAMIIRVMANYPNDPGPCYDMACAYSIKGDTKTALLYFESALQKGYKDYRHIQEDDDLINLRKSSKFKDLLNRYLGPIHIGDIVYDLPPNSRAVKLQGNQYFVSPADVYYQETTDKYNQKAYRVASVPMD